MKNCYLNIELVVRFLDDFRRSCYILEIGDLIRGNIDWNFLSRKYFLIRFELKVLYYG